MGRQNLMMQVAGVTLLSLSIILSTSASTREELERAAELAVERAAERVAEKAVEKALESGNSTTSTETIRASHSSVRKYDFTEQLPSYTILSPEERESMLRMEHEREAAELAVDQIRHTLFKRQADDFGPSYESEGGDDFDDIGPGFEGESGNAEEDKNPAFGEEGGKGEEEEGNSGFGRLPPFAELGPSFGSASAGFGLSSGDFPSSRFVRQYPYGNPYHNTNYQFVPVQHKPQESKSEAKLLDPKRKAHQQSGSTISNGISPLRVYKVETKPVFYYTPPTNHYAAPFIYQRPQVKIFKQGEELHGSSPLKEKRDRQGATF